jgi:hypothetical protein
MAGTGMVTPRNFAVARSPSHPHPRQGTKPMAKVSVASRSILCGVVLAMAVQAQCPPPGGYQPPPAAGRWRLDARWCCQPVEPVRSAAGEPVVAWPPLGRARRRPSHPMPKARARRGGPAPGMRSGPRTGGIPLSFERGSTSKDRLAIDWVHPVPPKRSDTQTSASGPLGLEEALTLLWDKDDGRPLLVLRECSLCKDGDEALLQRSLNNDRTLLLTKWFRTVRLPAHVAEAGHPFHNVFGGYNFKDTWPHFFLLAHPGGPRR